ncbi:MAG: hypothetical protein ABIR50_03975 [Ginsengibacter sp.]
MKRIFLVLLFYSSVSFADVPSLTSVRVLYQKAATEKISCKILIQLLSSVDENSNALLEGYKASATMMLAKYTFNPISKLSYFKKGKQMLENAIKADDTNIELRFLRFAVQSNIPFFLGYHSFIEDDKKILMETIPLLNDPELKNMITAYFKNSNFLTVNEKQQIK